jgi:hypothetical protein
MVHPFAGNRLVDAVAMPPHIARLPRSRQGYPIPWFVATLPDGTRDFRIADQERHVDALRFNLCWICGQTYGRYRAFVIGPMCAVNRISAEPPGHVACSVYSARVCPWLATPQMTRREGHKPDGVVEAAGHTIRRNPGVALVWVTLRHTVFRPEFGVDGLLCELGEPTSLQWFAQGRDATRAEVLESMNSGLPALREACQLDADPADSLRMLDEQCQRALALVPQDGVMA